MGAAFERKPLIKKTKCLYSVFWSSLWIQSVKTETGSLERQSGTERLSCQLLHFAVRKGCGVKRWVCVRSRKMLSVKKLPSAWAFYFLFTLMRLLNFLHDHYVVIVPI